jgi:hypothetical protein
MLPTKGCVICNYPMFPLKIQDPRDREKWVFGWKCQCTARERPDSLPQLTIERRDDDN